MGQEVIMAHDPVADDADAAVLDWETGLPPIKHEDLPRIVQQKIAAELTRIRSVDRRRGITGAE
jgi:hypothetical protein